MVRLYKNESGVFAFLNEKDYQNEKLLYQKLESCSVSKRTYRFCVTKLKEDGEPEQLLVVNPQTGNAEFTDLAYRFALYFPE
jgi:hypothetical protein